MIRHASLFLSVFFFYPPVEAGQGENDLIWYQERIKVFLHRLFKALHAYIRIFWAFSLEKYAKFKKKKVLALPSRCARRSIWSLRRIRPFRLMPSTWRNNIHKPEHLHVISALNKGPNWSLTQLQQHAVRRYTERNLISLGVDDKNLRVVPKAEEIKSGLFQRSSPPSRNFQFGANLREILI